jgi:hypothetical protein
MLAEEAEPRPEHGQEGLAGGCRADAVGGTTAGAVSTLAVGSLA